MDLEKIMKKVLSLSFGTFSLILLSKTKTLLEILSSQLFNFLTKFMLLNLMLKQSHFFNKIEKYIIFIISLVMSREFLLALLKI